MRSSRWKRIACAACLFLVVACAYRASASVPSRAEPLRKVAPRESVLHGKRLLTLGGYELNVSFTPNGKLLCFDISAG